MSGALPPQTPPSLHPAITQREWLPFRKFLESSPPRRRYGDTSGRNTGRVGLAPPTDQRRSWWAKAHPTFRPISRLMRKITSAQDIELTVKFLESLSPGRCFGDTSLRNFTGGKMSITSLKADCSCGGSLRGAAAPPHEGSIKGLRPGLAMRCRSHLTPLGPAIGQTIIHRPASPNVLIYPP
jgi:hypothetical protein